MFSDLKVIAENQAIPVDLESYVKKLNNSRRRVMLVNNILQNVQVCNEIFYREPDESHHEKTCLLVF